MDEKERQSAFITALTTEHFVLQTAANSTSTEAGTRASLYILSLSSSLVAMGFASRTPEIFVPFVAIVLPAVFLLGVFTVLRLVDSNLENMRFLTGIARIRSYYRTIMPEAADHFAAESGRWPEARAVPALRLGVMVGFITTTASMVAFINSIVAGVGVALMAGKVWLQGQVGLASLAGTIVAVLLMAAFLTYQSWRYRIFELESRTERAE
jgi:hypothetical protein